MPEPPPNVPYGAAAPRGTGTSACCAPVVKVQTLLTASALPARSMTPVVTVAVNNVLGARALSGVNVAIPLATSYEIIPVMGFAPEPGPASVKLSILIVAG